MCMLLQLRVTAYDSLSTSRVATSTVSINVIKNPSGPVFTLPAYEVTIPETQSLGSTVVNVTATDRDGVRHLPWWYIAMIVGVNLFIHCSYVIMMWIIVSRQCTIFVNKVLNHFSGCCEILLDWQLEWKQPIGLFLHHLWHWLHLPVSASDQ